MQRTSESPSTPCREPAGARPIAPSGFTLLELLVVVVIIGLLASFVAPRYFGQLGKSEVQVARAQIQAIADALDQFRLDVGRYPTTTEGLAALTQALPGEVRWRGPYLKKDAPADPWGRAYVYRAPGERGDYDLLSLGKDGRPGGEGEAADLRSN
ncbi:MAG: type II secretion system major pseudopilin GspG [Burkholderiales bacterium]|nr:type II secretion system major pseudopilin GspG [Burkholderiales bacterium]